MSDRILKKLASRIGVGNTAETKTDVETAVESRLNEVLDSHLSNIVAAHHSTHGNHHTSYIN